MDIIKQMFEAYFESNKRMGYLDDKQINKLKDIIDVQELEKEVNSDRNKSAGR